MTLLLVSHDLSLQHRTPEGHPERVDRVTASLAGLRSVEAEIIEQEAPQVDMDVLELVHDPEYIAQIKRFCMDGGGALDPDTYAVPASWPAALHAAGGGPFAVEQLKEGRAETAFVSVRPPGHHAERRQAMGFCIFNNIAVTAAYLRSLGDRVAIVDWDVHHGNGTQRSFYREPNILYVSLHEFPFYPGTGWVTESGGGEGVGATVNVPLPSGTAASSYLAGFHQIVLPVVTQFSPDWILVSAGYDAHVADPLGGFMLEADHYSAMASSLTEVVGPGRMISFLEGGYDLGAVRRSSKATVEGALAPASSSLGDLSASGSAARILELVVEELAPHWEVR